MINQKIYAHRLKHNQADINLFMLLFDDQILKSTPIYRVQLRIRIVVIRNIISIHAPPRGATAVEVHMATALVVSIHAPTRGATSLFERLKVLSGVSIHAPTRGATPESVSCRFCNAVSIHAPTRGATNYLLAISI